MQGSIISTPSVEAHGYIHGDDSVIYEYTLAQWSDPSETQIPGMRVEFDVDDSRAMNIYPAGAAPAVPVATAAANGEAPAQPASDADGKTLRIPAWLIFGGLITLLIGGTVALGLMLDFNPLQGALDREPVHVELLRLIPESAECTEIRFVDYEAIEETLGISLDRDWPELHQDVDREQVYRRLYRTAAAMSSTPWLGPFNGFSGHQDIYEHLSLDYGDMSHSVVVRHFSNEDSIEIIKGKFDPGLTHDTLMDCSKCEPPDIETHRSARFYIWGDDNETDPRKKLAPPAFDFLGRGGRIAVTGSYVIRTLSTDTMEEAIDAYTGETLSLADVTECRELADIIFGLGATGAVVTTDVDRFDYIDLEERYFIYSSFSEEDIRQSERSTWLRPYNGLAVGSGEDEKGVFNALVLSHSRKSRAERNANLLVEIIKEGNPLFKEDNLDTFDLDDSTIEVEDHILIAKFRGRRLIPRLIYEEFYPYDHAPFFGYRR